MSDYMTPEEERAEEDAYVARMEEEYWLWRDQQIEAIRIEERDALDSVEEPPY